jgi:hypothetical protein
MTRALLLDPTSSKTLGPPNRLALPRSPCAVTKFPYNKPWCGLQSRFHLNAAVVSCGIFEPGVRSCMVENDRTHALPAVASCLYAHDSPLDGLEWPVNSSMHASLTYAIYSGRQILIRDIAAFFTAALYPGVVLSLFKFRLDQYQIIR